MLLLVLAIMWGADLSAQKVQIDGIYYTFTGSGENAYATVVDNGTTAPGTYSGTIVIPNTVEYNDVTYKVTTIAGNAFKNSTGLTSITIPANITTIGNYAFQYCTGLETINYNATELASIPTYNYAFKYCSHACTVNIGTNVTKILDYTFAGLTNVTAINFNAINCTTNISSLNHTWVDTKNTDCNLTIGSDVTIIPTGLFKAYTKLKTVTINSTVLTTIKDSAFNMCYGIELFDIPNTVVTIEQSAFSSCTGLTSITIPASVTTIGNTAFSSCTNLTNITLNANLTNVPTSSSSYAFKSCTCTNVCTLTIGTGVTSIPNYTFGGLSNVGIINFNATSCADFTNSSSNIMPASPTTGYELYFGDNVTRIPAYLFNGKTIKHITIGSSVTSIGDRALYNSSSTYPVADIISKPTTPPTIAASTFHGNTKSSPVYVPNGSKSAYQAATNWSGFNNFKEYFEFTGPYSIGGTLEGGSYSIFLTGAGSITIENGGEVICDNILGATPENLIIEDGGQLICGNSVAATVQKDITASTAKSGEGWYTIASSVNNPAITSGTNLTDGTYDLYRFEESEQEKPWENYKAHSSTDFTTLENGRGYLYRNSASKTLSFTGNTNVGDVSCSVTNSGGDFAGFNLIGNPYPHNIYKGAGTAIPNSVTSGYELATGFHTLTNEGAWSTGTDNSTAILPGQGIMVEATTAGTITIEDKISSSGSKYDSEYIRFTIENAEYSDDAYAWFDKGYGLHKIDHRNPAIPMLYIPQDGEDYSIAIMKDNTEAFGLNFKANTTGSYTLKYKTKGNFDYLHVIDRLTGKDTDMLLDGEYSFVGSTQDDEARFIVKLAYKPNYGSSDETVFAYQSGSEILVSGEGELQIFDVTGRIVSTETINGVKAVSVPAQGVYVFRLVGENVKTQKIVIR